MDTIITADESKALSDEGKGLVTASEMKALADDRQDTISRYRRIVDKIREAASLGLYSITYHDLVGPEIKDRLWEDGFFVKTVWQPEAETSYKGYTYISWKFEPDREKEQERRDSDKRAKTRALNKRMASTP